jgi:hypothetical protein
MTDDDAELDERTSLKQVTQSYEDFLMVRDAVRHRDFLRRQEGNPEGTSAEAAIFSWLRRRRLSPIPAEDPKTGGPDFRCSSSKQGEFAVEVTSLKREAVTDRSGWPDDFSESTFSYGDVFQNLLASVSGKVVQLSRAGAMPRVLVICSAHAGATALLRPEAARLMLSFGETITAPLGSSAGEQRRTSDPDQTESVFLRKNADGSIDARRQSVSAVLLVALTDFDLRAVGVLNPSPAYSFDYRTFADVAFLRATDVESNPVATEWVIGNPSLYLAKHQPVVFTEDELTGKA